MGGEMSTEPILGYEHARPINDQRIFEKLSHMHPVDISWSWQSRRGRLQPRARVVMPQPKIAKTAQAISNGMVGTLLLK